MRWRVCKNKLNEMNVLSERENVKLDKKGHYVVQLFLNMAVY